jgi:putative Holliday junction resolvase
VVGNPIDEQGQTTDLSEKASRFARQLNGRLQLEVVLHDERFSSKEAKSRAREAGHKGNYTTHPIDDLAASIILESWLRDSI